MSNRRDSKYDPLSNHFSKLSYEKNERGVWEPHFADIEAILGFPLPASARTHVAWWANQRNRSHSRAWMDHHWKMTDLSLSDETVEFRFQGHNAAVQRILEARALRAASTILRVDESRIMLMVL